MAFLLPFLRASSIGATSLNILDATSLISASERHSVPSLMACSCVSWNSLTTRAWIPWVCLYMQDSIAGVNGATCSVHW